MQRGGTLGDSVKPLGSTPVAEETKVVPPPSGPTWCETHHKNDAELKACKDFVGVWVNPWYTNNTFTIPERGDGFKLWYNSDEPSEANSFTLVTMDGDRLEVKAPNDYEGSKQFYIEKKGAGVKLLDIQFEPKDTVLQKTGKWCDENAGSNTNDIATCNLIRGTWHGAGQIIVISDKGVASKSGRTGIAYKYEDRKVFFKMVDVSRDLRLDIGDTDKLFTIWGNSFASVDTYTRQ